METLPETTPQLRNTMKRTMKVTVMETVIFQAGVDLIRIQTDSICPLEMEMSSKLDTLHRKVRMMIPGTKFYDIYIQHYLMLITSAR